MKADVKSLAIPSDDSTTAVSSFVLNSPTSSIALAVNALGNCKELICTLKFDIFLVNG